MPTTATDTELVRQYLAGDQRALGDIYERYGDRVYDLCFAMLRSGDDAADAYQDTFLTAANKLDQLRDTERLRSWLYSVARNQCRARLRARKRSTPVDDAGVDIGTEVDMTADLGRDELRTLLTEASAGLNEREREVLDLHMRHELEGEELADALGVSVQNAYKLVQRVRDRVERSLGSLLIARHGRRECAELDALLGSWDGVFNPLWRKRISRHIDDCSTCTRRRAGLMDPGGLAGAFPLQPAPEAAKTALQAALLDATRPAHEIRRWRRDGFPAAPRRIPKLLFTAVAGGTLVVGGLVGGLAVTELIDRTDPQLETVAPAETTTSTTSTPATTTTPPTTTAAPTTTTTTTTTTTVPIDTEAPTINSIAPTPTGKSTPVYEQKCGGIEVAVVTVDASDNVGVALVKATFTDVVSQSGATGTIELLTDGTGIWTGSFVFPRGTIPPGSDTILQFTARAFDAAGNESAIATARPNTYLFACD